MKTGYRLSELVNLDELQAMVQANYVASGMPIGIVDAYDGAILVGAGWQSICVDFHRVHPATRQRCLESDTHIIEQARRGEAFEYKCRNGLWDIGIPVFVAGQHAATLFLGQFFYDGEVPDREYFIRQARQFGFDEGAYLAALDRVPVFSRAKVENILTYNGALAKFVGDMATEHLALQREIDERRVMEDALREANRALAEADRRKDEFLAMLSHELRNPLAPIRNASFILHVLLPENAQVQRQREIIDRQLGHMARLLDDLLDVARITRGMIPLRRERVDLRIVVAQALESCQPRLVDRETDLSYTPPEEPLLVEGDPVRLVQVACNLLNNALKFSRHGQPITVELGRQAGPSGAEFFFSVRDGGAGIVSELLPHVFELFFQADKSLDRTQGGLGLGLTLVQRITEMHGGRVAARSAGPGQGSEFTVFLPCAALAEGEPVATDKAEPVTTSEAPRKRS